MRFRSPRAPTTGCSNSSSAAGHRSKAFSSEVGAGPHEENASKQAEGSVLIDQSRSPASIAGRTATGCMEHPSFFEPPPWSTLADIAALTGAHLVDASRGGQQVRGLASLDEAGPMHLSFFDNLKYADQLAATKAGACLVSERFEAGVPSHVAALRAAQPFREFVKVARVLYSDALRPQSWFGTAGIAASAVIDPNAHLEDGVVVDPLAVIGPHVEIGTGTVVGAGAIIGANVRIGRDCDVGARCSIQFALIGNNVLIHPGCSIGQDGYGFVFFGPDGHLKVPQTGRVLIQNDVESGAGIGEGTKIDNQVQIGHNVTIGRHCLLAAQIGLAGSLTIGDNVALGAKVGINNHLRIGDGAQVTAMSAVKDDIPANGRWGGHFAKPTRQWFREILAVERLVRGSTSDPKGEGQE